MVNTNTCTKKPSPVFDWNTGFIQQKNSYLQLLLYTIIQRNFQQTNAFISHLGKHTGNNLANELGFNDFQKHAADFAAGKTNRESFFKAITPADKMQSLINIGVRSLTGVALKRVANGIGSLSNAKEETSPLMTHSIRTPMSKNQSYIEYTKAHVGHETSSRLKKMKSSVPNLDYDEKIFASSAKDYIQHDKRKNLMIKGGFNEKTFTFLMEDTYLRVKDYLNLYNQNTEMVKTLKNRKTKTDLYGCVYRTTNVIKIINKMDHYDTNIRIHLVKLKDQSKSVRDLIKDITNNSSNKAGPKKMYILDLTRTKGKGDSEHDLLSVLESIVDGMIYSPMYGKCKTLLMEPPHVRITSNYALDYTLLSLDRWKVYEIKENGTLGIENEILQKIIEEKERKGQLQTKKKWMINYDKKINRVIFSQLKKLPVITGKLILKT